MRRRSIEVGDLCFKFQRSILSIYHSVNNSDPFKPSSLFYVSQHQICVEEKKKFNGKSACEIPNNADTTLP